MKIFVMLVVCVLLGLPAAAQSDLPRFEPSRCGFLMPRGVTEGEDGAVRCGYVLVPEDRARPDSRTIRLAVAIFQATSSDPLADPLFYLDGGPGAATLLTLPLYGYEALASPFVRQRDVVFFDQRGVGFSEPALNCVEADQESAATLGDPGLLTRAGDDRVRELVAACQTDLAADGGVNLRAYNTTESAADVEAIRIALGYDQINLYGVSYGTLLAQVVMRDHPAHIRSVVLDAVLPLSAHAVEDYPLNFERVFDLFFNTCEADSRCSNAYPDLEAVFYETVDQLNAAPILVRGVPDPLAGKVHAVGVDGSLFVSLIFQQFYYTSAIPTLPARIYAVHDRQTEALVDMLVSFVIAPTLSYEGMGLSVSCADIVPGNSLAAYDAAVASLKSDHLRAYFENIRLDTIPRFIELCTLWDAAEEDPTANQPLSSDIPTLVFAGQFDPVTPPAWAQDVAGSLTNSFYYEVPAHGHGVTVFSTCPVNVMKAFLNDPTIAPRSDCIERQVLAFR
jgi:pimeloyl-ACP methyl ester carboxylesterase